METKLIFGGIAAGSAHYFYHNFLVPQHLDCHLG